MSGCGESNPDLTHPMGIYYHYTTARYLETIAYFKFLHKKDAATRARVAATPSVDPFVRWPNPVGHRGKNRISIALYFFVLEKSRKEKERKRPVTELAVTGPNVFVPRTSGLMGH